ncbi:MAG: ABC transporter permease, partial [Clostridiales Family XIII bacterium]|nr:ABC transporter permease [Clostridiales Family XIII bacterium]
QILAAKSRSFLTLAAIAMTCILVTSVVAIGYDLMEAFRMAKVRLSGMDAEVSFQYLTEEELALVKGHPLMEEGGVSRYIGQGLGDAWIESPLEIRTTDKSFAKVTFSTPTTGRLPVAEGEVAVKSWMLDALGLPEELGQRFPLSFVVGDKQHDLSLEVCGIWEDDYFIHPYGWAFVSDALADDLLSGTDIAQSRENATFSGVFQLFANISGSGQELQGNLDQIVSDTGIDSDLVHPRVNFPYEVTERWFDPQIFVPVAIILLIVLLSGYLLIYNIFSISVLRDIRHYGLLKTIGATRAQLRRLVNLQASIYCLVGIPAGMLLGYLLSRLLLPVLLAMAEYVDTPPVPALNPYVFLAAALLSLITVFVSCSRPARLAGRVSPVEATRCTTADETVRKKAKSGAGSKTGAGVGRMAYANLFRNRKKTFVTVASVSLGLILFNIIFTFVGSFDMDKMLSRMIQGDYVVADGSYFNSSSLYQAVHALTPEKVEALSRLPDVADVAEVYFEDATTQLKATEAAALAEKDVTAGEALMATAHGLDDYWLDLLADSVISGTFDREGFLSGKYIVVGGYFGDMPDVGDTVHMGLRDEPDDARTYTVMAKVDLDKPLYALTVKYAYVAGFYAFLPKTEFDSLADAEILSATVMAEDGSDAEALRGAIEGILSDTPRLSVRARSDYAAEMKRSQDGIAFVGIAGGVLLLLIGLLNYANTVITSILSRRNEFAMLQAIGMTGRQCKRMLTRECLYLILMAAAVFIGIGYPLSYGIVHTLTQSTSAFVYQFTVLPLLLCFPPICLIAAALPRLVFRSISKSSVVERLREVA